MVSATASSLSTRTYEIWCEPRSRIVTSSWARSISSRGTGPIRPSARSAHLNQLGEAGLERPYQRVDLRFGHRRGERARTRADDDATFVVEVIEQRLESARLF